MLIKKPYAFLIKNFKVIHGLLFIMLCYLSVKLFSIFSFFNDYASNHYYLNTGKLESDYISFVVFIVIILSVTLSFIIYYLLSIKRKENKIYLISMCYSLFIMIYIFYMFKTFQGLNTESIDMETVRLYRDFAMIALLPGLVLSIIMLSRTLGFNLKQFEFKNDLEELNIDVTDNEEVELTLGNDTYKIKRFLRKMLRLTKYFVLENKLFVICVSSIAVLVSCVTIFMSINVYDVEYNENTKVIANSIWYNVKSSYITQKDMNNKIINKGKTYLVVNLELENRFKRSFILDRNTFRLEFNNKLLFPIFNQSNKFIDFYENFKPGEIKEEEKKDISIIYELETKYLKELYILKILNYTNKPITEIQSEYKDIVLKPKNLDEIKKIDSYKIPAKINLNKSILKESELSINGAYVKNRFEDVYDVCIEEKCNEIKYVVTPDSVGKRNLTVLKLETDLILDNSLYLNHFVNNASLLIENYGYIEYVYLDKKYVSSIQAIPIKYNINKRSYLEVDKNIEDASKIDLILLIRGNKYIINLK